MREDAFRDWLLNGRRKVNGASLDNRTVDSRVSNCRTIERFEGNLDEHFDRDQFRTLLERLKFSAEDERRNRPARHLIPINGNVRNGTATLRAAVALYKQFRENWSEGGLVIEPVSRERVSATLNTSSPVERAWPIWDQPNCEEILALAHLTVPFVRFLNPDVVRAVVEDNELHRSAWISALQARSIDPAAYLWERSPCAFPGVRRYAGSREIAAYRGHTQLDGNQRLNALTLDDNNYPKQIWSFVFRGLQFSNFGPAGYALAHLADHKDHSNRFAEDFQVIATAESAQSLYGLYTCPSNTAYISASLIKPTDFVGTIRALLIRRAQQLYGAFCNLLPPFLRIPEASSAEWDVSEFTWSDPVGTTVNIPTFLEFRSFRMAKLIYESGAPQIASDIAEGRASDSLGRRPDESRKRVE